MIDKFGNNIVTEHYIGSRVLNVRYGKKLFIKDIECGNCNNFDRIHECKCPSELSPYCYVDVTTTNGVIQLVVYNIQNGYYTHDVIVKWDGFEETIRL